MAASHTPDPQHYAYLVHLAEQMLERGFICPSCDHERLGDMPLAVAPGSVDTWSCSACGWTVTLTVRPRVQAS
jgi:transcription elongation factor Elf1